MPKSEPKHVSNSSPASSESGGAASGAALSTTQVQAGWYFATTHWSTVLAAAGSQTPAAQAALEKLCRAYWKPLFVVARRFGHSEHDAQDLTQAFFEQFLEKGYIRAADPRRGRFRTFLLTSFRHFIRSEWVKSNAAKRGGTFAFVPWENLATEEQASLNSTDDVSVEAAFDRQWALRVFDEALVRLRAELTAGGKAEQFDQLKQFLSKLGTNADYARAGERLGMTTGAVAVAVRRQRVRYGELLHEEIANTVADAKDIEDELRVLKKALTG